MRQIFGDIKRAVFGRSFLIAFLGMILCLMIGAFSDALSVFRMEEVRVMYGYHRELLLKTLSSDIILFAVPILAAIPYTTAFTDDVKSGYLKPYLTRTSVSRYILGKGIGSAVSGGLALIFGIVTALGSSFSFFRRLRSTANTRSNRCSRISFSGCSCSSLLARCGQALGFWRRRSRRTCTSRTLRRSFSITF